MDEWPVVAPLGGEGGGEAEGGGEGGEGEDSRQRILPEIEGEKTPPSARGSRSLRECGVELCMLCTSGK